MTSQPRDHDAGAVAPAPGGDAPVPPNGVAPPAEVRWHNPANLLTLLRVALVPVIGVLIVVNSPVARWWAFGIFVFAALTDSIDGWVARRFVGVTRWGQLADPAADKALIIGSLVLLASLGTTDLPWWAVAVIIVREAAVTIWRQRLLRRDVVVPASPAGKLKTVAQVAAVTLYLLPGAPPELRIGTLVVAVVLTVASGLQYGLRGARIARQR